jgi:hypothetical protein
VLEITFGCQIFSQHLMLILLNVVCSLYINDHYFMLVNLFKAALHAWIAFINIDFQLQIVVHGVSTGEWTGHKE